MDGDRIADAENVDEVKERRGEIEGVASPNEPGEEMDPASFYPNTDAFPTSTGGLPPTGELHEAPPTDAIHPDEEHDDHDAVEDPRDPKRPGRATGGPVSD